jgi:D-serine dehydratase
MKLDAPAARALFAQRIVAVGSTGNLGLSIGTIAAALGFRAEVHMSHDAKAWKKDELRRRGVTVVEHTGDYAVAVAEGRRRSSQDSHSYFVDDENSILLFEGYAAAAKALAQQLAQVRRTPSAEQPLCVYLPCGVGGAPGGICAGLSSLFGPHVLCFFAEPVASPCVLIGMAAGDAGKGLSVYDFGLDNRTEADGLAVPQASPLVLARVRDVVSGIFTVCDESLFRNVLAAWETEGFEIEPSAAAAFEGPARLLRSKAAPPNATHVLWTTGGALVPKSDHEGFRARGRTS